jgi:hypothetical protein
MNWEGAIIEFQSATSIGDIIHSDMESGESTAFPPSVWRSYFLPILAIGFGLRCGPIGGWLMNKLTDTLAANHPMLGASSDRFSHVQANMLLMELWDFWRRCSGFRCL